MSNDTTPALTSVTPTPEVAPNEDKTVIVINTKKIRRIAAYSTAAVAAVAGAFYFGKKTADDSCSPSPEPLEGEWTVVNEETVQD